MQKHLNAELIEKMRQGKLQKAKDSLILDFGEGIEIHVDKYQYILRIPEQPEQYYHFDLFDKLIRDLLYKHLANLMSRYDKKNIEELLDAFIKLKEWAEEVLMPTISSLAINIKEKYQYPRE